jgi:hypothetical protein
MFIETINQELARLQAAAATFRQMQADHAPGTAPHVALSAHLADAAHQLAGLQALQQLALRATEACRAYRAHPVRTHLDELRHCYQALLVHPQHPLAARLLPRRPPPAPRTGCRACAFALLAELEAALRAPCPLPN